MNRAELDELRENWARAVLLDDRGRPAPCWFGSNVSDPHKCEGRIEGAHWIKQQRIRKVLELTLPVRLGDGDYVYDEERRQELILLAIWDPRNGVPACNRDHTVFDSQRTPLRSKQIVVWRHQVPAHVEAFAEDWGLTHELDRKHDTIGGGI